MTDTATTTDKWLGDDNPFYERFPECGLNEKQVATLVGFSGIRVSGLATYPAIRRLTESGIVEIGVRWGKFADDFGSSGKLWLADNGTYIASAMWEGPSSSDRGPIRVYRWMPMPPGQRFRRFDERAEEIVYERSDSHKGSTQGTRDFIKEHWMGATA